MIVCPNCGQDVADDSLHCGHCGHKLAPSAGKKTMFGFAAVSPEEMAKAAEEAKAASAKAAQQAAPVQHAQPQQAQAQQAQQQQSPPTIQQPPPSLGSTTGPDAPTAAFSATPGPGERTIPTPAISPPSNFKLPTPSSDGLGEESSSVFDLPKPGGGDPATIQTDSVGAPPAGSEPAWALSEPPAGGFSDAPAGAVQTTGSGDPLDGPAWANDAPTDKNQNIATAANAKNEPTFDMTPGPHGGAMQKSKAPVAIFAAVAVVVILLFCIIGGAVGLMFF